MATNPHPLSQSAFAGLGQAQGLAQAYSNPQSAAQGLLAQQMSAQAASQYAAMLQQAQIQRSQQIRWPQWVMAGKEMTLEQFVDAIWPDPQSPERSWFLLKYSNREP